MFRFAVCVAVLACVATSVFARVSYAPASYAPASYAPASYAPVPDVVSLPQEAEAQANAQTSNAGAQASAAKINSVNLNALDQYGYQIGVPLLVKPYGALTGLYAASLPARSFVGKIDPVFVQGPYGGIQHVSESAVGVAVI